MRILIGTGDGLYEVAGPGGHDGGDGLGRPGPDRPDSPDGPAHHPGRSITALGSAGPDVLAIIDEGELWRGSASGWARVGSVDGLRGNCMADTRAGIVVGTSEAHVYRAATDSSLLEPVGSFDGVDGRDRWYTPWGGPPDVRTLSEDSDTVYANVHVGGIVRTADRGATWEPTIDIDSDVHRVWASDQGVFAACAWGMAASMDRGDRWEFRTDGLHATYCRAVALCGDVLLVSASNGPRGGRSALYRTGREGGAFERCSVGLPGWFGGNIDSLCLDAVPDRGVAAFGTAEGSVFVSADEGASWDEAASGLPSVRCLQLMP
jgi:hypothetical protein